MAKMTDITDLRFGDIVMVRAQVNSTEYADVGIVGVKTVHGAIFNLEANDVVDRITSAILIGDYVKWHTHARCSEGWGKVLYEFGPNFWVARYGNEGDPVTVAKHASERDDQMIRQVDEQKREVEDKEDFEIHMPEYDPSVSAGLAHSPNQSVGDVEYAENGTFLSSDPNTDRT